MGIMNTVSDEQLFLVYHNIRTELLRAFNYVAGTNLTVNWRQRIQLHNQRAGDNFSNAHFQRTKHSHGRNLESTSLRLIEI